MSDNPGVSQEQVGVLPEVLANDDLKEINKALEVLLEQLRISSSIYNSGESDRAATLVSLGAVWRLLMSFQPVISENLHLPLMNLAAALLALNNSDVAPILRPTPRAGRAPDPPNRLALIGMAAGTVGRLVWTGMPVEEAHKIVAAELKSLGIRPARGSGQLTKRTVKQWCDRVAADRPLVRAFAEAAAPQPLGEPSIAVNNADLMLAPKWEGIIKNMRPDIARLFARKSLRQSVQIRVAGGRAVQRKKVR